MIKEGQAFLRSYDSVPRPPTPPPPFPSASCLSFSVSVGDPAYLRERVSGGLGAKSYDRKEAAGPL